MAQTATNINFNPNPQAQQQPHVSQRSGIASMIPDALAKYFRSPAELNPQPQGQQGQQGNGQQQQGQPPGNNGQQRQQGQQQQGGTPNGATNDPESFQNPLDVYKGLFDNEPPKDKDGKPIVNEPPKFNLDAKTIGEAASKIDFTAGLPKEVTDKLNSGQLDTQTMNILLNHVARNAYGKAMEHASSLTDRFVGMRLGHEQQALGPQVRRLLAQSQVLSNPNVAKNPAVREHMDIISDGLARKFPDATPEWIAQKTTEYFQHLAVTVNPDLAPKPPQQDTSEAGELRSPDGKVFDWGGYLTENVAGGRR